MSDLTVRAALQTLAGALDRLSDTPTLDAQVFLAHVLTANRTWVIAHPEAKLTESQEQVFFAGLARLQAGEPLPYVLGHWEFFGLDFWLNADTLIPRPETEMLVEAALGWLQTHRTPVRAVDVGAGSGCIAVSLAYHAAELQVFAGDISYRALQAVNQNAQRHNVAARVQVFQGDLLAPLTGPFDLICANLPYIPTVDLTALRVVHHEPRRALDGGLDGLVQIRRLLTQAPARLAADGLLLLEIEASQGDQVSALARAAFPRALVRIQSDLAGRERLAIVQPSAPTQRL
ncbi:MAG TPA: peptide chain release factor N(5)-glutamine methyltransferase [Anaerolineales bacterium]|nr:peptide chain release factor N(5)-glutamine methyltransferase [Anaerolineales bacterium]